MKLLYRTAEWHALAKLRMHTDSSLTLLESLTTEFGQLLRQFRDLTCANFNTCELARETAARKRREDRAGQGRTTTKRANTRRSGSENASASTSSATPSTGTRKCMSCFSSTL